MECPAMCGIEHDTAGHAGKEPGVGAALGAVTVQNIGRNPRHMPANVHKRCDIAEAKLTRHPDAMNSERAPRRQTLKGGFGLLTAGSGIANHANPMAHPGLLFGEIANMAEQSAQGRAQDMQDAKAADAPAGMREILIAR